MWRFFTSGGMPLLSLPLPMRSIFAFRKSAGFATLLLLALAGARVHAQVPATATPSPDPSKKNVPAEIVPPKAPSTPAPGKTTIEPSSPPTTLSPGTKGPDSGEAPERKAVDALSDPELDQVISLIKQRYIAPGALSDAAVKRATVQGLMERLGASASLVVPGATPGAA